MLNLILNYLLFEILVLYQLVFRLNLINFDMVNISNQSNRIRSSLFRIIPNMSWIIMLIQILSGITYDIFLSTKSEILHLSTFFFFFIKKSYCFVYKWLYDILFFFFLLTLYLEKEKEIHWWLTLNFDT
jgi:hypothetical protein